MTSTRETEGEVVEILKAAKERISDPKRWTRHELADTLPKRQDSWQYDHEYLREGSCWCASGAIGCEVTSEAEWNAVAGFMREVIGEPLVPFNDRHSHPEVLAAFDRAIELATKEADTHAH